MPYSIVIRPEAERDISAASIWYNEQRKGLGHESLDEIAAVMRILANEPRLSAFYYREFRRILLHRFPYKIFYQIKGSRVIVFRVLHAKQAHSIRLR